MFVSCVTVYVKEEFIQSFIEATIENHKHSVKEPGNLRFDMLQCENDPARFFLYEAYVSEESAAEHKKTMHYMKWRDTVTDWMAKPREGVAHHSIVPTEAREWRC